METISKDETTQAKYVWLADGSKAAALDSNGDGLIYKGNHVYRVENGRYTLESFSFEDGRVNKETDGSFTYNQHFTDHLGSVRAIAKNGTVQQERYNYYPFGLSWSDPTTNNRYLYNGKESQTNFKTDYLDYGARMYDPTIGRWHNLDPLAKLSYRKTPYGFCSNNPIRFVDMNGMLDDEYFNHDGVYLGTDNNPQSNNIRVMEQDTWDALSSEGTISVEQGAANSLMFSDANISNDAALNIYGYFNSTGVKLTDISNLNTEANMKVHYGILTKKVNGQLDSYIYDHSRTSLGINVDLNRQSGLFNNIDNVKNTFQHEYKHIIDARTDINSFMRTGQNIREINAINYQLSHPTWQNTTESYKQGVLQYKSRFQ